MPPTNQLFEIIEAQAISYRVHIETLNGTQIEVVNALMSLTIGTGLITRRVYSELQTRAKMTGDTNLRSLTIIRKAVEFFPTKQLDLSSSQNACASAKALMTEFVSELSIDAYANDVTTWDDEFPVSNGGTWFGLESLLLEAAAAGLDVSLAELLSPEQQKNETVKVFPLLRPTSFTDQKSLSRLSESKAFFQNDAQIWIDLGKRFTVASLLKWIRQAEKTLDLPSTNQTLYLYRPLRSKFEEQYAELLNALDGHLATEVQGRVKVIEDLDKLSFERHTHLNTYTSYGLAIRPTAVGGILPTLQTVDLINDQAQEVPVFLVDNPGGEGVAFEKLLNLSSSRHNIQGIASPNYVVEQTIPVKGFELPNKFWERMLDGASVKISASGEIFRHQLSEKPNSYEEAQYLGPVGPVGSKARLLQKASLLAGFNTIQYTKSAFVVMDNDDKKMMFHGSATPINTAGAKAICNHKETTRLILQNKGIPVPEGRSFNTGDLGTARQYATQLGYPVVVKPAMGTMGIGVKADIRDENELNLAFEHLNASRLANQGFIVEKHINGEEYRILVVGDEVIAAVQREPASVIGDGIHNVAELILRKNRFRRSNPQLASSPIVLTDDSRHLLIEQGLELRSVPEMDRYVALSSSSNISLGGDSREILDRLHPSVIEASIEAVRAVPGLNYCGVDFLLEDPALPLDQQSAGICELNAQAASGTAEYPLYGTRRPVPQKTVEKCIQQFMLTVTTPSDPDNVALELKIRGRVTGVGYREWFKKWADEFGLVGEIRNLNTRTVVAQIMGKDLAVAAMSAAAISGPRRARPTSVASTHISPLSNPSFNVIK